MKWGKGRLFAMALVVVAILGVALTSCGGEVASPRGAEDEQPIINPNPNWEVVNISRLSACDNRPGLKMMYVWVRDAQGNPLAGVKVRFDTEPSFGVAYDHPNIWGRTNKYGYLEWDHFGVPTRYILWMEDDATPLITRIRTDLGNEYCRPEGTVLGWFRPVNRPGIYSYRIEIQQRSP